MLGGLSVQPMTGYALREAIRDVLGHFWSESYGQIYPTLADLEQQGLVRREGAARTPPRNGLLLRLYFGRHLGPAACRTLV